MEARASGRTPLTHGPPAASKRCPDRNPTMPRATLRAATVALPFLLAAATAAPAAAQPRPGTAATRATVTTELTADQQVRQVLGRLTFGARPGDVDRVRAIGVERWIDEQLHPERIDDAALERALGRFPTLARSGAELLRDYPPPAQLLARRGADSAALREAVQRARRESARIVGELQTARVARAVASERQLHEVLVDFWENHFNVFAGKDRVRYFLPEYDATIRAHALGRFRDLLGAVAKSPAMLQYLDNVQSVADSGRPTAGAAPRAGQGLAALPRRADGAIDTTGLRPAQRARLARLTPEQRANLDRLGQLVAQRRPRGLNENYARELMELHTLGVDGGYTQQDVVEVARALTGWTVRPPAQGCGFVFRPEVHDAGAKTILGHAFPAGRGIEDGEQVLDVVARHPATARFVARKLAVRLVSDAPPAALVERAAATFRRSDGDIRETVRTIVTSPEFLSRAAYRAKVKTPFELVVSAARALGGEADTTPRTAQLIARLGQPIFGHQAPDGWPQTGSAWMNTGAILNRINFGLAVAANRLPGARLDAWPAGAALRGAPREAQVDGVVAALLGGEASPDTRAVLVRGENPLLKSDRARAAADGAMADAPAMDDAMDDTADARARRQARRDAGVTAAAAAREAVRPGRAQPAFAAPLPRLDPFAQIVGLALGAPEFQRK